MQQSCPQRWCNENNLSASLVYWVSCFQVSLSKWKKKLQDLTTERVIFNHPYKTKFIEINSYAWNPRLPRRWPHGTCSPPRLRRKGCTSACVFSCSAPCCHFGGYQLALTWLGFLFLAWSQPWHPSNTSPEVKEGSSLQGYKNSPNSLSSFFLYNPFDCSNFF